MLTESILHTLAQAEPPLPVTVIGGSNMDICGVPFAPLIGRDSNPGRIRMSPGGVGRNIAHNLRLLGTPVRLITVFGDDLYKEQIYKSCADIGIDVSESLVLEGKCSSSYLFITNEKGDMELAVSDMDIYNAITPDFLTGKLPLINSGSVCVADTNIPSALACLAENVTVPLFVDPVSVAKAGCLKPLLPYIHTIKPNRLESEFITGIPITDEESISENADYFLAQGVKQVFLSLGTNGVFAKNADGESCRFSCLPVTVRNATGAGDSFMAALVFSYLHGLSLEDTAHLATLTAAVCLEGAHTINEALSLPLLADYLKKMRTG